MQVLVHLSILFLQDDVLLFVLLEYHVLILLIEALDMLAFLAHFLGGFEDPLAFLLLLVHLLRVLLRQILKGLVLLVNCLLLVRHLQLGVLRLLLPEVDGLALRALGIRLFQLGILQFNVLPHFLVLLLAILI